MIDDTVVTYARTDTILIFDIDSKAVPLALLSSRTHATS